MTAVQGRRALSTSGTGNVYERIDGQKFITKWKRAKEKFGDCFMLIVTGLVISAVAELNVNNRWARERRRIRKKEALELWAMLENDGFVEVEQIKPVFEDQDFKDMFDEINIALNGDPRKWWYGQPKDFWECVFFALDIELYDGRIKKDGFMKIVNPHFLEKGFFGRVKLLDKCYLEDISIRAIFFLLDGEDGKIDHWGVRKIVYAILNHDGGAAHESGILLNNPLSRELIVYAVLRIYGDGKVITLEEFPRSMEELESKYQTWAEQYLETEKKDH